MGLSKQFADQIKWEVEHQRLNKTTGEVEYTRYKNMEVNPRWLKDWVNYMEELEKLIPPHYSFTPRGIGINCFPKCSFCKERPGVPDMASFISRNERNEVAALFKEADIILHFRSDFESWPQVKIGSCNECKPKLERLYDLVSGSGVYGIPGTISLQKLLDAKNYEAPNENKREIS